MDEAPSLRSMLGRGRPIWIMGAHDVLSAKIAERAGFDAVGIQSLQMSFVNGVPDIGVIGPEELVRCCAEADARQQGVRERWQEGLRRGEFGGGAGARDPQRDS